MKVIDLLNKIANGEEVPKKIKFYGNYYIWYDNKYTGNKGYCLEPVRSDSNSFLEINTVYDLNYEVEIIEEEKKIPEKLYFYEETQNIIRENNYKLVYHDIHKCIVSLECKYNEIIDYLDYLKSKGE